MQHHEDTNKPEILLYGVEMSYLIKTETYCLACMYASTD